MILNIASSGVGIRAEKQWLTEQYGLDQPIAEDPNGWKIEKQELNLDDFLQQMEQLQKMGPLENILKRLPGADQIKDINVARQVLRMIDKLEDLDDVQNVTYNSEIDPDILEQLDAEGN